MPRLGSTFKNTVFFLYGRNPDSSAAPDELVGPCGSGVIVGIYDGERPDLLSHYYAITAAHVARTGASVISFNTRAGQTRFLDLDPSEWAADIDWEDIAAADITDRFQSSDEINYVTPTMFLTEQFMSQVEFGIGEDGFMLGLFAEHSGEVQNLVAARFGNVSMLADPNSPVYRKDDDLKMEWNTPCHVFDMHSRPGFSGSPVFVYRTPDSDIRELEYHAPPKQFVVPRFPVTGRLERWSEDSHEEVQMYEVDTKKNRFLKLLGIHVSQFHDQVRITKVPMGKHDERNQELKDGDTIRFPGSMTIVVPASRILRLLQEDKSLVEQRNARRARLKPNPKRGAVVMETKKEAGAASESDNPAHKEDFTRLLGAAARKQPQDGQT
ncbi:MAG TPA: hypothetical protein VHU18_13860 [Rhizomicrobium sp.]|jgi:hypothetical protein|nr:hypothetical protein [Rhizomicrobium sp.]